MSRIEPIVPNWPAPSIVRAVSTTRTGGVGTAPFDTLNLGTHVGDDAGCVARNRKRLVEALSLPCEPVWLAQVHGRTVVRAENVTPGERADAAVTDRPGIVLAIQTADCLPVIFCNRAGTSIGAAHAGWRGLVGGVLDATVEALGSAPEHVMAWLGPAIGPAAFEVGDEVREAFVGAAEADADAFTRNLSGRWQADLYALARARLARLGVRAVYGGGYCTYNDPARFFSYRRDGRTGRMATLAWLAGHD